MDLTMYVYRCRRLLVALAVLVALAPRGSSCWDAWDRSDLDLSGPSPWDNLIGEGWRAEEPGKAPPSTPPRPPPPSPPSPPSSSSPPSPGLAALSCNYSNWEPVPSPWPGWINPRVCKLAVKPPPLCSFKRWRGTRHLSW